MRYAHSVEKVRAAEGALMATLPEGTLMGRAAAGLAAVCARVLGSVYGARVAVLAGSGDNGGDALYAGAILARRGARVEAVAAGAKVHEEGLTALRRAGGRVATEDRWTEVVGGADLVVDGLLGIGGRGGLRDAYAGLAGAVAEAEAAVVACDLPSGVDADSGRVDGPAITADVTVTFGTYKPGLLIDPAAARAGVLEFVDIGLGPYVDDPDVIALQAYDIAAILPLPTAESDKYRRGVAGVVAGSAGFSGAAVLSVGGAVAGGAGMVRFASIEPVVQLVRARWPEAVTTAVEPGRRALDEVGRVQAWVVGPGMGTGEESEALLAEVMSADVPVLVDADGLTILARRKDLLRRRNHPTVVTPHAGELGRLLGTDPAEVEARRLEHVTRAAGELGATVLLKGSTTLVAEPGRPVRVNPTGTPWLATAGSGDVLSGLIGALLAQGVEPIEAAAVGAYLHGLAARRAADTGDGGGAPISAVDVIEAVPDAIRTCHTG